MNEKDIEYENNNIAYDYQYTEEDGGGIKCKIMNCVKRFYLNGGLNVKVIIYVLIVICCLELGEIKQVKES